MAIVFAVELYDAATGRAISNLAAPINFAVRPPPDTNTTDLAAWAFDSTTGQYEALPLSVDADRRVLAAELQGPGSQVVAVGPKSVADRSSVRGPVAAGDPSAVSPSTPVPLIRRIAPLPARLVISSIGVDAPVTPVGLEPNGIMAAPTEGHVVGWYELGARPGEQSNAVLTGHVDWQGKLAVFVRLRELQPGDTIDVDTGLGTAYRYVVGEVTTYSADTAPVDQVFGPTPDAILTLITCDGAFDATRQEYADRVVVRAHAG